MHDVEGLIFSDDGAQLLLLKKKKAPVYRGLIGDIGEAEEDNRKAMVRAFRENFQIHVEKEEVQQFHLRMERSRVLSTPVWFTYYFRMFDTGLLYETYEKAKLNPRFSAMLTNKSNLELASMEMPWLIGMALDRGITHSYTNYMEKP